MTTPSGWTDPNPRHTTDPRTNSVLTIAAVALAFVVIVAFVGVVLMKRGGLFDDRPPDRVVMLIAANKPGANPFTPPVVTSNVLPDDTSTVAQQLPVSADRGVRAPLGTTPGLYGVAGQTNSCDAAALASYLDTEPDLAAAWASTLGITPGQVPFYLNTLTPVLLLTDTWVTSNSYSDGRVSDSQVVLQNGSAVLIDTVGVPRVHCASGNPLQPPANVEFASFNEHDGPLWPGFDPPNIVAVQYTVNVSDIPQPGSPVNEFAVRDLESGQPSHRKAGGTINLGPAPPQLGQLPDPMTMNRAPMSTGSVGPASDTATGVQTTPRP